MDKQELTYLNTLAINCLTTSMRDEAQPSFELIDGESAPDAGPVGQAGVELAQGNYDKATDILKQCAQENRQNADQARKLLMHALVATNRLDEADELRDSLTQLDAANDEREYLVQTHKFFGTGDPRLLGR